MMKTKKPKKSRQLPVVTWPITLERYRQVLYKMHRQYLEINRLKNEIEFMRTDLGPHYFALGDKK